MEKEKKPKVVPVERFEGLRGGTQEPEEASHIGG